MTSKTTSSIWKRSWRSSSRGVRAPSETRISPSLRPSPWRCCMSRARSRSASLILPVRSSSAPRGWGLERISANMMAPPSNEMVPALCRSSDVTRSTPVFRLRSRSWKTSWMPSSRSGPSIAMESGRVRGEDVLQVERGAGVRACGLRERPAGVDPRHLLPRLHGLAVAMHARQGDAELEQRLHLLRVELERPLERLQRLGIALVVEQRAPEEQQRRQVVRVLLEHLGQPHDRLPDVPRAPQQVGERQRRLVERGQRVERPLVRSPRLAPLLLLLVQPSQVEPHLDVAAIELQRRPVRGERARLIADLEGDVSLQLMEIGAAGSARLRLLQRGERSGGIAPGGSPLRRGDERVHVVRRELKQLLRQPARLLRARAAQGEQRLDLAEPRLGAPRLEAACLAVALERLAVQAALREDVPEQDARFRAARAPLHGADGLGGRDVHQALAYVSARQA